MTTFDVFLSSSRDEDRFTKLIYKTLCGWGMKVFIDDEKLLIEDNLSDNIVKAIEGSSCSIIVLTDDYVSSKRCLRELAKIMDHVDKSTHQVLPVFLKLDPNDILHYSLKYFNENGDVLPELLDGKPKEKYLEEVQRWREATTKISNLTGVSVRLEDCMVFETRRMIKKIFDKLLHLKWVAQTRNLVEIPLRLRTMEMLLGLTSRDIRMVGIVGMGGIGKTTIAEALYDKFASRFLRSCFIRVAGRNLVSLQQQLLFQLDFTGDIKILDENHGVKMIRHYLRLHPEKALIIFDGINDKRQLEMLAGSIDWFCKMSRIIFTTRNKDILRLPGYKDKVHEYNVELLSNTSAFSLFCKHAFGDNPPDDNSKDLCNDIIEKVGRLPLALTKVASSLYGKGIDMWEDTLKSCPNLVYGNILFDTLKTSFEGLEADTQQIFLDLACFFNGEKVDRVIQILKGFGYSSPHTKLQLLVDRCLVDISDDHIQMHISTLCIGQEIVHRDLRDKQKQSRIWLREDFDRVFREKYELKYIQGIMMDLEEEEEEEEELILEAKSFTDMTELKILQIKNVQVSEDIVFLSNQLTLLNWPGYPSKCLPSTFQPPPLLELHLPGSNIQRLWFGKKKFESLKEIDVSDSENLVETPDFSEVPNLRRLILRNCERLHKVDPSINSLEHLVLLDLGGCGNLTRFSSNISCKSLRTLILSNSGLEYFPKMGRCMECLTELHIDGTSIYELSPSIKQLIGLVLLNLRNCTRLSSLPTEMVSLSSLRTLILNGCKNLNQIPQSLGNIEPLEELDIGGTSISHAPTVNPSLWNLRILNCERLTNNIWRSLTGLSRHFRSLKDLNLSDCNLVDEDIPNDLYLFSSLEILDLSSNHFVWLSESIEQLINLQALYLNDCNNLKQLPRLPASLRYVGGEKFSDMFRNSQGSSANTPSYLLSNPPLVPLVASCKTLVGMEHQLEKVCNLLDLERSNEVVFVGILGLGGTGKTSIAEVVYNTIAYKFEATCFLYISNQNDLVSLQQQMFSQLLSKEIQVREDDPRIDMIKDLMSEKKVLIVLDGVDEKRQIEKVAGSSPSWIAPGSRVIITSRNREILHQLNYVQEYNMELLSHESAYELFCRHAFGDGLRDKNDLCNEIVEKLGRLPIALRTTGCFLHNKDLNAWEETLKRLGEVEEDFFATILQRTQKK